MTPAQQIATDRFNGSRSVRGVTVSLFPNGPEFTALVQPIVPTPEQYALSQEVRSASKVFILRADIGAAKIGIGSVLVNQDSGESYRITMIEDNSIDVRIAYVCETAQQP